MNIGIYTECYKPIINGVVVSIESFRQEFEKQGHKVFIVAPYSPGYVDENNHIFRLKSLSYPAETDYRFALPYPRKLFKEMKKVKFDIVHTQHPFMCGLYALNYAKQKKVPLVFTFHTQYQAYSHYFPLPVNFVKKSALFWAANFCNKCDLVVTPSETIKKMVESIKVKSPIKVIPTGININDFQSAKSKTLSQQIKKEFNIPQKSFLLITAGRLAKEKNFFFLLKSFKLVTEQISNVHLLFAGDGPVREDLFDFAREQKIIDKVTFAGMIPRFKLIQCYTAADLFVFSSLTETQGLVVIEAMASGTPVIVVDAAGVSEVVEDAVDGFKVAENEKEFARKIILILKNEVLRIKMANNARKKAKSYTSQNMALKLLQEYQKLINANNK